MSPSGVPPFGPPYMPQRRNATWLPRRSKVIVRTSPDEYSMSTSPPASRFVPVSKRSRWVRRRNVELPGFGSPRLRKRWSVHTDHEGNCTNAPDSTCCQPDQRARPPTPSRVPQWWSREPLLCARDSSYRLPPTSTQPSCSPNPSYPATPPNGRPP